MLEVSTYVLLDEKHLQIVRSEHFDGDSPTLVLALPYSRQLGGSNTNLELDIFAGNRPFLVLRVSVAVTV